MHRHDGPTAHHGRACLSKAEAARRKAQVARVDYALDLVLPEKSASYRGEVTVDCDLGRHRDGLFLDFQGRKIVSATVNGAPASLTVAAHRIALPEATLVEGRNTIVVAFENDFDQDGSGLYKAVDPADGREYVFSDCEPFNANRFFPCFDQPDLKATYAVTVTAPADWVVVANGSETAAEDVAEGRRHRFARTERFSTYVVAVCAGPYKVWTDETARIPSRLLARQSMAPYVDVDEIFELTRQGFDFFEGYFGIPYPYGKYDQVFVPDYNMGAMENVACVVHSDRMLHRHAATERERRGRAVTILHEMAHMWFGDLVTMEWWDDLWLNESFATYLATLALVRATRFKDGFEAFRQDEKRWAYWQDELPTTHPIATEVADTVNAFTNFDGITYGKGASVLKQLSFYAGEESFRAGVAAYLRANAGGNARCADFLAAIGEASRKDLDAWSKAWLKTSGVNGLVPEVHVEGGRIKEVRITQTPGNGDGVLRPHRVRVAVYGAGPGGDPFLSKASDVTVEGREATVDGLVGVESPVFVLVNHEDHAYAKAYLDPASLAYATENLERLPGAMLRTEIWSTVHMMVRDQQAPPTAFVDLFVAKAGLETNDKLVSALHRQVKSVLDLYLPDARRPAAVAAVNEVALEQARRAPAGSDLAKAWFDVMSSTSETPAALDRLVALLEGRETIEGLTLDPERRWGLVTRLCAFAHPRAEALWGKEKAADPSERGERAAFRARVARPDPKAKDEAWARFRGGADRLDLLREGMGAFHWPHQREVLRPYAQRYFDDLAPATSGRDLHFGAAFVNALYPGFHVEPATVEKSKAFLATRGDLPAHLRRGLIERTAEVERALKVRATVV
ncbi:MAG: aminopeptidase N [Planctomycetes bacterium]|nr:aminopeptidase N [Planctomycetota bacterium]